MDKIGMFAYTGLSPEQMDRLAKEVSDDRVLELREADPTRSTRCTQPKTVVSRWQESRVVMSDDSQNRFTKSPVDEPVEAMERA